MNVTRSLLDDTSMVRACPENGRRETDKRSYEMASNRKKKTR
jgi:hypothetical protein